MSKRSAGPQTAEEPVLVAEVGEPERHDPVTAAILAVQADPEYHHVNAEHLEVRVVRKLVEGGLGQAEAEHAVRSRLY